MTPLPLVLLVDDYADTRDLYGTYLRMQGYRIAEAEDGMEGVMKAVDLHPAVIVMDIAMPILDGFDATRRLKQEPRTEAIPVICLTAHGHPSQRARALREGCVAFLTKPCLPREVAAEIARVLGTDAAGHEPRQ
jgi:CheY-like chemotaxis protein